MRREPGERDVYAPAAGASGKFANNSNSIILLTWAGGTISAPFTANTIAGGPYSVKLASSGVSSPPSFSLTNTPGSPPSFSLTNSAAAPIVNGGFETGTLSGWSSTVTASVVTDPHSGSYAAQLGSTSPTNGDSTITQTFTATAAVPQLSLYSDLLISTSI